MGGGVRNRFTTSMLLAEILSGRQGSAARCFSAADWQAVTDLAFRHRVHLQLGEALRLRGENAPTSWMRSLEVERGAWLAKREVVQTVLEEVAEAATRKGIELILLKGPNLAERLYPDPAVRVYRDLDLLVRKEQFPELLLTLGKAGFRETAGPYAGVAPEVITRWNLPVTLSVPETPGVGIDLHTSPLSRLEAFHVPPEGIWDRSEGWESCLRQLSSQDFLLHLFIHAMKHGCLDLLGFLDLEMASRRTELRSALPGVLAAARSHGFAGCVGAALEIGRRVLGTRWPEGPRQRPSMRSRLVASLTREAVHSAAPIVSERVQILLVHPILLDGWFRRARFLCRLLVRPPETIGQEPFMCGPLDNPWAAVVRLVRRVKGNRDLPG